MVATLTGIFGIEHLTLAEDVVQEALARALQTWPFYGVPKNPAAWIMRASRNLALDVVRREKVFRGKEPEISRLMEDERSISTTPIFSEQEIADDRLRMMFVCCHPQIPAEAQVTLAAENTLRFQRDGNCPCLSHDGRGHCQTADAREAKNRRGENPF